MFRCQNQGRTRIAVAPIQSGICESGRQPHRCSSIHCTSATRVCLFPQLNARGYPLARKGRAENGETHLRQGIFMETTFDCLRHFGPLLAERILETYPPLQSTKDPIAPSLTRLLRKALPAQAVAIMGTAKYLRNAKSARIVAECGAGKTYMALGTIHVLAESRPTTTLVMCPSHIVHKWAREVLLTIPRARTFLIEDMRNGGDPDRPHGVCEVKLRNGKITYEGKRLSLAEMR